MSHFQLTLFSFLLILLLLLAAFFSCAETSLMAVNRYRLRHKARLHKRYAVRLLKLLKRPDRLLGAILIGSTFATMLASSLATLLALHFWGDQGAILAAFILSFIVLIFAEIAPKTLAAIYPDQLSRFVSYPVQIILKLLYPAVWLANAFTNGLFRLLKIRVKNPALDPFSSEELRSIVYEATGKISRQYQNMLLGILDLNKLTVEDIMIPQHEIVGIDIELPWEKIITQIHSTHFNQDWIPFYQENLNQIVGILYARDIFRAALTNQMNKENLQNLLHEPYFVPEGTTLSMQLNLFQQHEAKVAFVVDEYGEILGLLSLNDILEEIVGDFNAKMSGNKKFETQADGSYVVDGAMPVREFNRATEWELPQYGARTINGLIVEYLESLPHTGIALLIAGYPVEIVRVKANFVTQAKIFPRLKDYSI